MPRYDYICDACGFTTEVIEPRETEPVVEKCPSCRKTKWRRCFNLPIIMISGEPATLGKLAEKNSKGMSKEERARKAQEYKTKKEAAHTLPFETCAPESIPEGYKPFYKKAQTKNTKEVIKMTPDQKKQYIEKG